MSASTARTLTPPMQDVLHRPLAIPSPRAEESLWRRIKNRIGVMWKGSVLIMPITNEETKEYAHRWPTPMIIGMVMTVGGMIINTVLTLTIAGFLFYANTNKDSSTAATTNAAEITSLKKDVEYLRSENVKKDAAILSVQEDYKVIETTLSEYRIELAKSGKVTLK